MRLVTIRAILILKTSSNFDICGFKNPIMIYHPILICNRNTEIFSSTFSIAIEEIDWWDRLKRSIEENLTRSLLACQIACAISVNAKRMSVLGLFTLLVVHHVTQLFGMFQFGALYLKPNKSNAEMFFPCSIGHWPSQEQILTHMYPRREATILYGDLHRAQDCAALEWLEGTVIT